MLFIARTMNKKKTREMLCASIHAMEMRERSFGIGRRKERVSTII